MILGDKERNRLVGDTTDDVIKGFGGRDTLIGLDGHDTLEGGWGDDHLMSGSGDDVLLGGDGDDRLFLNGPGTKTVSGGDGLDVLVLNFSWSDSAVTMLDEYWFRNAHTTFTEDRLFSLDLRTDYVRFDIDNKPMPFTPVNGIERFVVVGTSAGDTLVGWLWNDWIFGGDGDDYVTGRAGDDTLIGGDGNDWVGAYGEYRFWGIDQSGEDSLIGGRGNDTLAMTHTMSPGTKEYGDGGSGSDTLYLEIANGDHFTGELSRKGTLTLSDGMRVESIENLTINSYGGDNTLHLSLKSPGRFKWFEHGYRGWDLRNEADKIVLDLSHTKGPARLEFRSSGWEGEWETPAGTYSLEFEYVGFADVTGNNENNYFKGGAFADRLNGLGGNDTLASGRLGDTLIGGDGNDQIQHLGPQGIVRGGRGEDIVTIGYSGPADGSEGEGEDEEYNFGPLKVFGGHDNDLLLLAFERDEPVELTFEPGRPLTIGNMTAKAFENFGLLTRNGDDVVTIILDHRSGAIDEHANSTRWDASGGDDHLTLDLSRALGPANLAPSEPNYFNEPVIEGQWDWMGRSHTPYFSSVETFHIVGNRFANSFEVGDGDDVLFGMRASDTLIGGAGDDLLDGGAGADHLTPGPGDDTLIGGGGADMFIFARGMERNQIVDFDMAKDRILLNGMAYSDLSFSAQDGGVLAQSSASSGQDATQILFEGVTLDQIMDPSLFVV